MQLLCHYPSSGANIEQPFPTPIFTLMAIYIGSIVYKIHNDSGTQGQSNYSTQPNGQQTTGPTSSTKGVATKPVRASTTTSKGSTSNNLWTLVSGIPAPGSWLASLGTVLINIVLVLMVVDLTFGPKWFYPSHELAFARVGFVSYDSAKILVREPASSRLPIALEYRLQPERSDDTYRDWTPIATASSLEPNNDFTAAFSISHLLPDTRYEYRTSTNQTGIFTTAPSPGHVSSSSSTFTFLHSSCLIPNFPYLPLHHHLSIPGFTHLANLLPRLNAQFMLFLGDFIYVDVPRRHGTDRETYRREYRQVYASPDWPSVSDSLPWIHVYDDHEIANDWDKNTTGVYHAANDPFTHYQASVNPPAVRDGASYFAFTQGPASFFLIDTRRYRTPFDGTDGRWDNASLPLAERKSMLGSQQRDDLLSWLGRKEANGVKWKIVVSSIPFTKNWRFGSEDTWAGYLGERQVLLDAMWDAGEDGYGVVVLSGDRHEFAATKFPPPASGEGSPGEPASVGNRQQKMLAGRKWSSDVAVHEFSTSPLSMFYLPVRTYRQEDDEDVVLKYLPDGNSKFGAVNIREDGRLDYQLFIDGKEAWEYSLGLPKGRGVKEGDKGWKLWN